MFLYVRICIYEIGCYKNMQVAFTLKWNYVCLLIFINLIIKPDIKWLCNYLQFIKFRKFFKSCIYLEFVAALQNDIKTVADE